MRFTRATPNLRWAKTQRLRYRTLQHTTTKNTLRGICDSNQRWNGKGIFSGWIQPGYERTGNENERELTASYGVAEASPSSPLGGETPPRGDIPRSPSEREMRQRRRRPGQQSWRPQSIECPENPTERRKKCFYYAFYSNPVAKRGDELGWSAWGRSVPIRFN